MIELYTWSTPNGRKITIFLEETGLPYSVHPINITRDEQFDPKFLSISPNNKIPAIVDTDTGLQLMESGAILLYLSKKADDAFMPESEQARWKVMEWLMWQMGGFGPMLGQAHHFLHFNSGKSGYAEERYGKETKRLYRVLDERLSDNAYLAGDEYSLADIATWPWASRFGWQGVKLSDYANVTRWYCAIAQRPAVQRAFGIPNPAEIPMPD